MDSVKHPDRGKVYRHKRYVCTKGDQPDAALQLRHCSLMVTRSLREDTEDFTIAQRTDAGAHRLHVAVVPVHNDHMHARKQVLRQPALDEFLLAKKGDLGFIDRRCNQNRIKPVRMIGDHDERPLLRHAFHMMIGDRYDCACQYRNKHASRLIPATAPAFLLLLFAHLLCFSSTSFKIIFTESSKVLPVVSTTVASSVGRSGSTSRFMSCSSRFFRSSSTC